MTGLTEEPWRGIPGFREVRSTPSSAMPSSPGRDLGVDLVSPPPPFTFLLQVRRPSSSPILGQGINCLATAGLGVGFRPLLTRPFDNSPRSRNPSATTDVFETLLGVAVLVCCFTGRSCGFPLPTLDRSL